MNIKVTKLQTNQFSDGLSNIVEIVYWEASDDQVSIKGSTKLKPPKKIFTPLEQLTNEIVSGWVLEKDGQMIKKKLQNLTPKNMKAKLLPPWSEDFVYSEPDDVKSIRIQHEYDEAVKRLARYVLLEGQPEIKEMQPTGEQVFNEETGEMDNVMMEVVIQNYIEPVEEYVQVTTVSEEGVESTESIRNPVIVKDEQERADAQATIDSTPEEYKP
jgi:hypothetical protein